MEAMDIARLRKDSRDFFCWNPRKTSGQLHIENSTCRYRQHPCLVLINYASGLSPVPSTQSNGVSEVLIKTLQNSSLQLLISLATKPPRSTAQLKAPCTNPEECFPPRQQWGFSSYCSFQPLRDFPYSLYGNLSSQF